MVVIGVAAKDRKSQRWFVGQLVEGADRRLSTSKCQAVAWTAVAVFGVVEVFVERLLAGTSTSDPTIPVNLLIAMGFSAATMTAAKGITVSYVDSGLVNKGTSRAAPSKGGLVSDDDGVPDLSKIQMLAFTVIAVVVYVVRMSLQEKEPAEMVDIEPALMVLMGLSQGAYIGKKLTTTASPRVSGLSPATGKAGDTVTLAGLNFGDEQDGGLVSIDGTPVADIKSWSDRKIEFKLPAERSPTVAWKDGDRATLVLVANGREATAPSQFVYSSKTMEVPNGGQ
jgi:hypothetical protein